MDFLICQTSAASPAEPGELLFWFSTHLRRGCRKHYELGGMFRQSSAAVAARREGHHLFEISLELLFCRS